VISYGNKTVLLKYDDYEFDARVPEWRFGFAQSSGARQKQLYEIVYLSLVAKSRFHLCASTLTTMEYTCEFAV
jgi:hypothetical protein